MKQMMSHLKLSLFKVGMIRFALSLFLLSLTSCNSELQVSSLAKADVTKVDSLDKVSSKSGESINVTGSNLTADIKVKIEEQVIPLTLLSPSQASFVVPSTVNDSVNYVEFWRGEILVARIPLLVGDAKVPTISMPASSMCKDILFKNGEGEILRGERICDVTSAVLPACSKDGEVTCQANSDYPAVAKSEVAVKLMQGETLVGITGTAIPSKPDCSVSGSSDCRVDGTLFKAVASSELNDANIRAGINIAGTTGTLSTTMPPACSSEGDVSCIANTLFPAIDTAVTLSASNLAKIHSTLSIANVSGTLGNCSSQGSQSCYVAGSYHAATDCSANDSNCFIATYDGSAAKFKAVDFTTIIPGSIKNGVTIAGIGGLYPNNAYPLTVSDAVDDITTANFNTKITSSSNFAWFDRNGTRYSHAGAADIVDSNILSGKQIFSIDGSLTLPSPWDLRYGMNSGAGKLKVDCRNTADITIKNMAVPQQTSYDSGTGLFTTVGHNFVLDTPVRVGKGTSDSLGINDRNTFYVRQLSGDSYKLSNTAGGTTYQTPSMPGGITNRTDIYVYKIETGSADIYDTLFPYTASAQNPWPSSGNSCVGLDSSGTGANVDKVWEDVTVGGCSGSKCIYKDRISGKEWSKSFAASFWAPAARTCEDLVIDSKSDWRLPTMYELQAAAIHGMYSVADNNWISTTTMSSYIWSITMNVGDDVSMATLRLSDNNANTTWRNDGSNAFTCVRP